MTDVLRQLSATVLELSAEGPYVLPSPPPSCVPRSIT